MTSVEKENRWSRVGGEDWAYEWGEKSKLVPVFGDCMRC